MVITKIKKLDAKIKKKKKKLDAKPLARCLPQHTQITPVNSILVVTVVTTVAEPTHRAGTVKEKERGAVAVVAAAPVQCGPLGTVVGQARRHPQPRGVLAPPPSAHLAAS